MNKAELKNRTKKFAHDCTKLIIQLPNNSLGFLLTNQLLRSSTSVAANYRAACLAQSKASFISKLSIEIEEADESLFWLEFIIDENLAEKEKIISLLNEAEELTKIFISSRKTAANKK
jgi:four helix bundle protein